MNKIKKVFVLVMIVAVVSLGLVGCKDNSEHPAGEHPTKEAQSEEHPNNEHPNNEHPK